MTTLKSGCFYRTCGCFPAELAAASPCGSHAVPLVGSPVVGVPLRVSEDTSIWFRTKRGRVKIAKGRMCYLAQYDEVTNIGIIFLCTTSGFSGFNVNRFVRVYGGERDEHGVPLQPPGGAMLQTDPLGAFPNTFHLNISHPIRVRVVIVSHFSELRQQILPIPPPEPIGLSELKSAMDLSDGDLGAPDIDVRLQVESEVEFWALRKNYHKSCVIVHGGGRSGGGQRCGGGGSQGGGGGGGNGGCGGVGGSAYHLPGGRWRQDVAPWGRIGQFRYGFELPLIAGRAGSDSDSAEDNIPIPKIVPEVVAGTVCLCHLKSTNFGGREELEDDFEMLTNTSTRGSFEIC